jgi:1-aminocyclopropane-1-carboxylate deaminase/D-cysteine desulfhydrase-like pyridoxal-dependent ACC family enzyme
LDDLLMRKAEALRAAGRKTYVWDRHKGRPFAAISYALCLAEVVEQMQQLGLELSAVYTSAAGATGAGLVLGKVAMGLKTHVRLIAPIRWPWDMAEDMAEVANRTAALLGLPHRATAADVDVIDTFVGPQYGMLTPEGWEAMRLLATTEGILLDPSYTAKAMAGLIADVRAGRRRPGEVVVFIHTGGVPAVFAYRDELLELLRPNR